MTIRLPVSVFTPLSSRHLDVSRVPALLLLLAGIGTSSIADAQEYPTELNARPHTLPAEVIEAGASLTFVPDSSATSLVGNVGYGVTDDLELNLAYGLALSPDFSAQEGFTLGVSYRVIGEEELSFSPSIIMPVNFGAGELVPELVLGADTRVTLADTEWALHFGHDVFTYNFMFDTWFIQVPFGVDYQFSQQLNVGLDTTLLTIGEFATTSIDDSLPLILSAFYAFQPSFDVYGGIGLDAINIGPSFGIFAGFAYRNL